MAAIGTKVAQNDELLPGGMKAVVVNGHRVLLIRTEEEYFAIDEMCSHEEESLAGGYLEGLEIECPRHGSTFNIATGEVKSLPAVLPLGIHRVTIGGDGIYVALGAARE